ncbi:MAG: hypothetical protein OEZ22_03250 [Spirochaetia bacterium]|nr:hypothetical protein [Spirochaetia bacterium]
MKSNYTEIKYFLILTTIFLLIRCSEEKICDRNIEIINKHDVEGYSNKISYSPGETIDFHIHSLTDTIDIEIIRYGRTNQSIYKGYNIPSIQQNYDCGADFYGCNWKITYQYIIPENLLSGIYSAFLTNKNNEEFYISFVIKNNSYIKSDIVILANTNTWQAYNAWEGNSFYKFKYGERIKAAEFLSFLRPNIADSPESNTGHLLNAELHLYRWIEEKNYAYDVIADIDLHNNQNVLNDYKMIILNAHPEYFTTEMYNHLLLFIKNGGNLIYLGGNAIFRKVILSDNQIERLQLTDYHNLAYGKGGEWDNLGRSQDSILGIKYSPSGYNTYFPYRVIDSNHWIFNDTNLKNGDTFGEESLNGGAASGHELDKIGEIYYSDSFIHLAKGMNPEESGADMVFFEMPNGGGKVFSVGSITFTGSLPVDENVSIIVENVINKFLN